MQLSDDDSSATKKSHEDNGSGLSLTQDTGNELKLNQDESMFLETQFDDEAMRPIFDEIMAMQTRHAAFGSTNRSYKCKPIKAKMKKLSILIRRYPSTHFPLSRWKTD